MRNDFLPDSKPTFADRHFTSLKTKKHDVDQIFTIKKPAKAGF